MTCPHFLACGRAKESAYCYDFYRFCTFRRYLDGEKTYEREFRPVDITIVERLDENMKPVLDGNASRGL